ncbi:hypothetical protein FHS89_001169 [Rubricella aquisinus]|uniref:MFS transporter n=1 Tax=Rubricella aquisinus TaxID=2028108 RepID=A0A840WJ93_9RHOB|nr:DUF6326 family protein [Rubricella aquisinus]MBB5515159.1 hypothetical protein [Rubricella aquisinus]
MPDTPSLRTKISLLWVFVSLNIVFADVLSLYTPGVVPQLMTGVIEGVTLSEELMLMAAIFIQIPVGMIVLTQVLPARRNRIANIVAAGVTILFVVGGGSLKLHYIFFASCEVIALLVIIYLSRHLRHEQAA